MDNAHNSCRLCSIAIKDLSVTKENDVLLKDINLEFHCGELTALIGKNGAGKTTLIRSILGQQSYSGEITFFSHEEGRLRRPVIGYVPQQLAFDKSTPISVGDFCLAGTQKKPLWLGAKKEGLTDLKKRLEIMECSHLINRRLGDLSGGELQRVMLTAALNPNPDLLILDEPVSGMDAIGLDIFYKTVLNLRDTYHTAILIVSHDLGLIRQYADKTLLLDKTVLVQGDTKTVFSSPHFVSAFGLDTIK